MVVVALALSGCGGSDELAAPPPRTLSEPAPEPAAVIALRPHASALARGRAKLIPLDETTTRVVLEATSVADGRQAAHIHNGTCLDPGGVRASLSHVEDGRSVTHLDIPVEHLLEDEFAIDLHEDDEDFLLATACGNIAR